jgi:hypothetical protein
MLFSALRVPVRILEHPIESVIASLLLLALLFVSSADPHTDAPAGPLAQNAPAKM